MLGPEERAAPPGRPRRKTRGGRKTNHPGGKPRRRAPRQNPPVDRRRAGARPRVVKEFRSAGRRVPVCRQIVVHRASLRCRPSPGPLLSPENYPPGAHAWQIAAGKRREVQGSRSTSFPSSSLGTLAGFPSWSLGTRRSAGAWEPGAVGWCKRTNPRRFNSRSPVPKSDRFAQPIKQRAPPRFPSWSLGTRRSAGAWEPGAALELGNQAW